jgi:hypothetical protein
MFYKILFFIFNFILKILNFLIKIVAQSIKLINFLIFSLFLGFMLSDLFDKDC